MPFRRFRQIIPRPPSVVAGGPAPWAGKACQLEPPISLDRVVRALGPVLVPPTDEPDHRPHAAVLVPLFERAGDAAVVLIRRSLWLTSNPGDLAFPGGRLEPGERALDAALREAHEEVGLHPAAVSPLGRLAVVRRARVPERVVPYVGLLSVEPVLRPDPGEVDAVLTVTLAELVAEGVYWEEEWQLPGEGPRRLPFFAKSDALGDDVIWGMTAMVLRELLSAVASAAAP
jgi:8-oxo-dGTP pyrophosphatase MutT (NUDIX family)